MLSKNEIKLLETRNGQTIRRLVFTELGFIRLVDDFHYEGIQVDNKANTLTVKEISPTVRLSEEDYVLEQTVEENEQSRFEMLRFTDGRLRSLSLSSNLAVLQAATGKNREINRWINFKGPMGIQPSAIDRIFLNGSWHHPSAVRNTGAILKNLIPHRGLWEGTTSIHPLSLIGSLHKLYRLFAKQQIALNKRNKHKEVIFSEFMLEEKGVWYFELQAKGEAKLLTTLPDSYITPNYGQTVVKISEVADIVIEKPTTNLAYIYGKKVYNIELIQFITAVEKADLPTPGME